jgi:hypothetical protein
MLYSLRVWLLVVAVGATTALNVAAGALTADSEEVEEAGGVAADSDGGECSASNSGEPDDLVNFIQVKMNVDTQANANRSAVPHISARRNAAGPRAAQRGRRGQGRTWRERTDYSVLPEIEIDLDLPPAQRWAKMVEYYGELAPYMMKTFEKNIAIHITEDDQADWIATAKAQAQTTENDEELEELQGIADMIDDPAVTVDTLLLWNLIYEMGSPTDPHSPLAEACSGVLAAMPNGTVVHGRNMDYYFLFEGPGGVQLNWPNITFNAIYMKGGVPIVKSTQWPLHLWGSSLMRLPDESGSSWTFEQNTRPLNDAGENLAAAKLGGKATGTIVRAVAVSTADYRSAVAALYSASFMAPQYFIMAGGGAYEGAVLTIDRLGQHLPGTPKLQYLNSTNFWEVQTNDDQNKPALDPRRPLANLMMADITSTDVSTAFVADMMSNPPLYVYGQTVFSCIFVPATGFYENFLW